jgi:hypothetical protein
MLMTRPFKVVQDPESGETFRPVFERRGGAYIDLGRAMAQVALFRKFNEMRTGMPTPQLFDVLVVNSSSKRLALQGPFGPVVSPVREGSRYARRVVLNAAGSWETVGPDASPVPEESTSRKRWRSEDETDASSMDMVEAVPGTDRCMQLIAWARHVCPRGLILVEEVFVGVVPKPGLTAPFMRVSLPALEELVRGMPTSLGVKDLSAPSSDTRPPAALFPEPESVSEAVDPVSEEEMEVGSALSSPQAVPAQYPAYFPPAISLPYGTMAFDSELMTSEEFAVRVLQALIEALGFQDIQTGDYATDLAVVYSHLKLSSQVRVGARKVNPEIHFSQRGAESEETGRSGLEMRVVGGMALLDDACKHKRLLQRLIEGQEDLTSDSSLRAKSGAAKRKRAALRAVISAVVACALSAGFVDYRIFDVVPHRQDSPTVPHPRRGAQFVVHNAPLPLSTDGPAASTSAKASATSAQGFLVGPTEPPSLAPPALVPSSSSERSSHPSMFLGGSPAQLSAPAMAHGIVNYFGAIPAEASHGYHPPPPHYLAPGQAMYGRHPPPMLIPHQMSAPPRSHATAPLPTVRLPVEQPVRYQMSLGPISSELHRLEVESLSGNSGSDGQAGRSSHDGSPTHDRTHPREDAPPPQSWEDVLQGGPASSGPDGSLPTNGSSDPGAFQRVHLGDERTPTASELRMAMAKTGEAPGMFPVEASAARVDMMQSSGGNESRSSTVPTQPSQISFLSPATFDAPTRGTGQTAVVRADPWPVTSAPWPMMVTHQLSPGMSMVAPAQQLSPVMSVLPGQPHQMSPVMSVLPGQPQPQLVRPGGAAMPIMSIPFHPPTSDGGAFSHPAVGGYVFMFPSPHPPPGGEWKGAGAAHPPHGRPY